MDPTVGRIRMSAQAVCCFVLMLALPATARSAAPAGEYGAKADEVMAHLQKTFWDSNRALYVKAANDHTPDYVWREAAAFSALVGAARHEPKLYTPVLATFFHSLDGYWDAKAPVPGYEPAPTRGNGHDKYYDDNAWLVITFVEAFELTGDRAYLTRAEETARFVDSGWDDKLGGGIWWHASHKDDSKNTCANGPAAVGYLRLARHAPPAEADDWAKKARAAVDWTRDHLQASDGLFDDRVIVSTGEVKRGRLTYNSALMERAWLELFRREGHADDLAQAKRVSRAADWFADANTGSYRDPLKWSQFMIEADIDLHRATGEAYLMERAKRNIDALYTAWKKEPPPDMMSNAAIARLLWLMVDTETEAGRAFWRKADGVEASRGADKAE